MRVAAPAVARTLDTGFALADELPGRGAVPVRDPQAGTLDFGGALTTAAVEVGVLRDGVWEWAGADWPGVARARRLMRDNDAADLAADRVDLSGRPRADHLVEVLSRTAVHLGGARGHWAVPGDDGVRHYALTGDGLPRMEVEDLQRVVETAADIVQQLTLGADRYAVMREMVLGLFESHGLVPWHAGEPDMLMGNMGLYQFRVYFSEDGTVNGTSFGLLGAFG